MTSQGSSYARFRRALATGNLNIIRSAAAELPRITLTDALAICVAMRESESAQFEQAAVRWLGRFSLERARRIDDVRAAAAAFDSLRRGDEGALAELQTLSA